MPIIKQPTPLSNTEKFINKINNLYSVLRSNHTSLMQIWEKPEEEIIEILTGLGTDAKSVFIASSTIQGLLKTFDTTYEVIYPYKWVETEEERTKVMLNVTFNEDGSFNQIT
jgi:hypothetical protein